MRVRSRSRSFVVRAAAETRGEAREGRSGRAASGRGETTDCDAAAGHGLTLKLRRRLRLRLSLTQKLT